MATPYKMKGHTLPGIKQIKSPAKHTDTVDEGPNRDPKHATAHNKRHAEGGTHGEIGSKDNKWTKDNNTQSPAKIAALAAMAGKAILGHVAGKVVGKVLGGKKEEEEE